ncbi:hypothetical protein [Mucilaginibacter gilvus]|uniref:Uncharacterized protein n=1 Tax=Mucilaginibacter gilvus TaxID=2305909 RepID=A0A3S3YZC6_9SPHI|nr:hypothetical protein [Mucilaginibacter gilvus]RWY49452.1 hypothetical protein EPL05_18795 [Mucilaginibacter gilvus]
MEALASDFKTDTLEHGGSTVHTLLTLAGNAINLFHACGTSTNYTPYKLEDRTVTQIICP